MFSSSFTILQLRAETEQRRNSLCLSLVRTRNEEDRPFLSLLFFGSVQKFQAANSDPENFLIPKSRASRRDEKIRVPDPSQRGSVATTRVIRQRSIHTRDILAG